MAYGTASVDVTDARGGRVQHDASAACVLERYNGAFSLRWRRNARNKDPLQQQIDDLSEELSGMRAEVMGRAGYKDFGARAVASFHRRRQEQFLHGRHPGGVPASATVH